MQQVSNNHQEFSIVDFVFDSQGCQHLRIKNVYHFRVFKVLSVKLAQDDTRSLTSNSFLGIRELFKERMEDQVDGFLVVSAITFVNEAELKYLDETHKASVSDLVNLHVEEHLFHALDHFANCFGHRKRLISFNFGVTYYLNEVRAKGLGHGSEKTCVEGKRILNFCHVALLRL